MFDRKILKTLNDTEISLVIREAGRRLNLRTLSRNRCNELVKLISKPENFVFQWSKGMTITGKNGKIIFNYTRKCSSIF